MDAYQDQAIQRWHVRRADSLTETREWIAGWQGGWAAETGAHWAVIEAESDILLGRAALSCTAGSRPMAMGLLDGCFSAKYRRCIPRWGDAHWATFWRPSPS